ncbi:NUDIX domain-containing protein [Kitasatospora sp. NBC_01300]|uniref:NUDIX domain-containing protein n=1 Tax=Kitasatospora sp. NBC_01300 TaxID=2903574 RepID=UPI00352D905F|nr:NUDIX domain-containing protein [Kitasatospora sp. NBC_01300]
MQGTWDLPVGKSEPGEPITETAVRELSEEAGRVVASEDLQLANASVVSWRRGFQRLPDRRSRDFTGGPVKSRTESRPSTRTPGGLALAPYRRNPSPLPEKP